MEAAHLQDGHVATFRPGPLRQLREERPHPLPLGADLAPQHHFTGLIANTDCQLLAMHVDSQVQHRRILLG